MSAMWKEWGAETKVQKVTVGQIITPCKDFILRLFFLFVFWSCSTACGILVPRPGMEPGPET